MKWITTKDWPALTRQYNWVAAMHGVPQSGVHHAEGDVAVHTQMVLAALESLAGYKALDNATQEILWLAALMHDIEKRSTTFTTPEGDIVSPGHARKGAATTRHILFTGFDMPFAQREQVVQLVRYHGLPVWLMEKPDPCKALLEASLHVDTSLLYLLAKADMLGRSCNDQADMLERIAFFKAYCIEQQCWGRPYAFASGQGRFAYFCKDNALPDYQPFDDSICEVTVMSGLPGMGKDHYIRKHLAHLPLVSLDNIRKQHKLKPQDKSANGWVAQQAKEQARIYLRAKQPFVWNATNITRQMRSQLIALLAGYKARVNLVYVEKPFRTWQQQNKERDEMVPAAVLDKMLHKLEVPKLYEAHTVTYEVE